MVQLTMAWCLFMTATCRTFREDDDPDPTHMDVDDEDYEENCAMVSSDCYAFKDVHCEILTCITILPRISVMTEPPWASCSHTSTCLITHIR